MNLARQIPYLLYAVMIAGSIMASKRLNARKPASLHGTIHRAVRDWLTLAGLQAAYIGLFTGLWTTSLLPMPAMLAGSVSAGLFLICDMRMIILARRAARTYDNLGPLAYLAEIRFAFGSDQHPARLTRRQRRDQAPMHTD